MTLSWQLEAEAPIGRGVTAKRYRLGNGLGLIAAWSACRIAERGVGPLGMRAPGELFRAEPALRAIARAAELTIEPSFG